MTHGMWWCSHAGGIGGAGPGHLHALLAVPWVHPWPVHKEPSLIMYSTGALRAVSDPGRSVEIAIVLEIQLLLCRVESFNSRVGVNVLETLPVLSSVKYALLGAAAALCNKGAVLRFGGRMGRNAQRPKTQFSCLFLHFTVSLYSMRLQMSQIPS